MSESREKKKYGVRNSQTNTKSVAFEMVQSYFMGLEILKRTKRCFSL